MPTQQISIIIISWNVSSKLRDCLASIRIASKNLEVEVIVVDNASHDGSGDMVEGEFPEVTLIKNSENRGTSRAVNQALEIARGEYVLWLNPDMRLFEDTLVNSVEVAREHPEAGIVGIRLENEVGEIVPHVRKFPKLWDQFWIVTKIAKVFPGLLDDYLCRDFEYGNEAVVDSIRGSYFLMPATTIAKLGKFDERFFVWFEEVDYCRRAVEAGMTVLYTPRARAVDFVGQSFAQVPVVKRQAMFVKSMVQYFMKWGI